MTYADLIWQLIKSLEQKDKELNQALEIIHKSHLLSDCSKYDEVI